MDRVFELVLVTGMIVIAMYSMKLSQESMNTMRQMNQQIQMMFVKS